MEYGKKDILYFIVQDVRLCIDLNFVEKVLPLSFIDRIPNSTNYVVGIMNVAGQSTPVIDLALRIGLQRNKEYSIDATIILCNNVTQRMGLVVDTILGIEQVEQNVLQMNESFIAKKSYISGVIKLKDELLLQLDMAVILDVKLTLENEKLTNKAFTPSVDY